MNTSDNATVAIRRGYVDGQHGQVHFYTAGQGAVLPDLYCLHATAYSGRSFATLMAQLVQLVPGRRVIALDTPGYGASDGPAAQIEVAGYAGAIGTAIRAISGAQARVDLFGYHTGALIGIELAAQAPALVRRMALAGVPFFEGADHAAWRAKLVHEVTLEEALEQFRARWDFFVTARAPGLPLARGFDNFVDELRCYPRDWWAHAALFRYDGAARLPLVSAPVHVINPASALAPHSRAAAALMPHASVAEWPALAAPLDLGAAALAQEITAFLDAARPA